MNISMPDCCEIEFSVAMKKRRYLDSPGGVSNWEHSYSGYCHISRG